MSADYIERLHRMLAARAAGVEIVDPPKQPVRPPKPVKANPRIKLSPPDNYPRCGNTREELHPSENRIIILQCVEERGHKAGCHYENPSNRRK